MVQYTDPMAGFAVFRQGRSLCVRLDGALGTPTARGVRDQLRADRDAVRLRLECSGLYAIDPEAGHLLAGGILDWVGAAADRSVDVLNLHPSLDPTGTGAAFGLFRDPDELVFLDPDRPVASGPATPSRH